MPFRKSVAPHLPIWRDAQRLLVWAEQAVRRFSRYHKYTLGAQLREQALTVCRLVIRAQATARAEVVTELHLVTPGLPCGLARALRAEIRWQV